MRRNAGGTPAGVEGRLLAGACALLLLDLLGLHLILHLANAHAGAGRVQDHHHHSKNADDGAARRGPARRTDPPPVCPASGGETAVASDWTRSDPVAMVS